MKTFVNNILSISIIFQKKAPSKGNIKDKIKIPPLGKNGQNKSYFDENIKNG